MRVVDIQKKLRKETDIIKIFDLLVDYKTKSSNVDFRTKSVDKNQEDGSVLQDRQSKEIIKAGTFVAGFDISNSENQTSLEMTEKIGIVYVHIDTEEANDKEELVEKDLLHKLSGLVIESGFLKCNVDQCVDDETNTLLVRCGDLCCLIATRDIGKFGSIKVSVGKVQEKQES